jgi:hypothetical protein
VSTIGVGGNADQALLRRIASAGGGEHHAAIDPRGLPRLVAAETVNATRRAARTAPFRPTVASRSPAVRGIAFESAPPLHGRVPTRLKPGAQVWLSDAAGAPLLAGWDLGLGRAAAFTADGGAEWSREWTRWNGFAQLLRQVARVLAPPSPPPGGGAQLIFRRGPDGTTRAVVRSRQVDLSLDLVPLKGEPRSIPLLAAGADRFVADAELPSGHFVTRVRRGPTLLATGGLALPIPSAEYAIDARPLPPWGRTRPAAFANVVEVPLATPLLLLAVLLFLLGIGSNALAPVGAPPLEST